MKAKIIVAALSDRFENLFIFFKYLTMCIHIHICRFPQKFPNFKLLIKNLNYRKTSTAVNKEKNI